jgi:hypothetical protein
MHREIFDTAYNSMGVRHMQSALYQKPTNGYLERVRYLRFGADYHTLSCEGTIQTK